MVGSISHELRTPLNIIMSLLDVVLIDENKKVKDVSKSFLKPALSSAHFMLSLINDILDFTKNDFNEDPRMTYKKTNLRKLIQEVKQMFEIRTESRKLDFPCEIDEDIPATFYTDARRLNQIVINLIGNAIKFTYDGFIKVTAKYKKVDGVLGVEISV